jgi:hypothetical protein
MAFVGYTSPTAICLTVTQYGKRPKLLERSGVKPPDQMGRHALDQSFHAEKPVNPVVPPKCTARHSRIRNDHHLPQESGRKTAKRCLHRPRLAS